MLAPGDPDLPYPILARGALDPFYKLGNLMLEVVELSEQIGLEHHEQVPVVFVGV